MQKLIIVVFLFVALLYGENTKLDKTNYSEELIVPGKVIVKYKNVDSFGSVNKPAKNRITSHYGLQNENALFENAKNVKIKQQLNLNNVFVYEVPSETDINNLVSELESNPSIEYAEPVYLSKVNAVPNDALYSSLFHLPQIKAEKAWDIQYGDSSIVIGIIDTGVDWKHEDLVNVIWKNTGEIPDNGIDDDGNGYIDDIKGWDFVTGVDGYSGSDAHPSEDGDEEDNDPMDFNGHGTHVAGIAAGETNNGIGIASVAAGARIMPLRCGYHANNGNGYVRTDFAARAYLYAADNGADIVNQSSGNSGQLIVDAALYAFLNGVLVVTSAGNADLISPSALGAQHWVMTVAAVNQYDIKAYYSSYGDYVTVSAPGGEIYFGNDNWGILSSVVHPSSFYNNAKYFRLQGTSMAAPLVASVAGLVKSYKPNLNPVDLFSLIEGTADNIDVKNPKHPGMLGSGRVNVYRAMTEEVIPKPDFSILSYSLTDNGVNSNSVIEPGENVVLNIDIQNKWADASNVFINVSFERDWPFTIANKNFNIGVFPGILDYQNSTKSIDVNISCAADAFPQTAILYVNISADGHDESFFIPISVNPQVLFVADFEQDENKKFDFSLLYFEDLVHAGISFDYVHRLSNGVTADMLNNYSAVVWACEWQWPTLDANDRQALKSYLDNGGSLFLSGQDIGWDLHESVFNVDVEFYANYLKAYYIADDAGQSEIQGIKGDPITDGISSSFYQKNRLSTQQFPDEIAAVGGSVPIYKYPNGSVGAIRYRNNYDLVYFAFGGYESMLDSIARRKVLKRIMNWFAKVNYELQVINDTEDYETEFEVNINVESTVQFSSVKLYYLVNESYPYTILDMNYVGNGNYTASIPAQPWGSEVKYFVYIQPENGNGVLTETVTFYIGEDVINPNIKLMSNQLRNSINRKGIEPYELYVELTDNFAIDPSTALLHYRVNDETSNSVLLTSLDEKLFSGTFSFNNKLNFGDKVSYCFSVRDLSSNSNLASSDTLNYLVDTVQVVDDFEFPYLDWEITGTWGLSTEKKNGLYSLSDSPDGHYANNTNSTATYKMPFDLSSYISGEISYYLRSNLEVGVDSLLFELSNDNGLTWKIIDAVSQNYILFAKRTVNISAYTGIGFESVKFRFRFYSNGSNISDGVYIDDVVLNMIPDPTMSIDEVVDIPSEFRLSQNYPNPFNPSTTINFALPVNATVNITVYNILGEVVEVLKDNQLRAGRYSLLFNAANKLSSGIYLYRISAFGNDGSRFSNTKKMLLVK